MSPESTHGANLVCTPRAHWIGRLGSAVRSQGAEVHHVAAVIGEVLCVCVQPRSWSGSLRKALSRQVLAIGVEPLWFVGAVALFVGISLVVQLTFWIGATGQSQLLGPLLVAIVARELGPLLINLIVIVRSGSSMTSELAILRISGEVRALEAKGANSFLYLVVPRVLGLPVATFCLTTVFILLTLSSGYVFAALMGVTSPDLRLFADTLSSAVQPKDIFNILAKSLVPALFAGATCCIGGLGAGGSLLEIPRTTQRALTRSVAGLFVISAIVSLLTYL